jgi:hypothetical protein
MDMIEQYLHSLLPSEKSYLDRVQNKAARWIPQSEPQWLALLSRADELFYGGAAGGGKSSLLIGLAAELAEHAAIFRRVYPNLKEIIQQAREVIKDTGKENKSEHSWELENNRTLEFGAVQYEDNKKDWQGRPHDHKLFDELPEFTETQYVFICGWNRSKNPNQRVRIVATGNPPIDEAGNWIIKRWGAWLDPKHPNPAKPGELRWYATIDGEEKEFLTGDPIITENETVYPLSRTFIPARLDDNPFLSGDNRYRSILQSLPEPLRSQMLYGDFQASSMADPWQIIPTEWVLEAQRRWLECDKPDVPLTAVGIDPARGGRDNMSLSKRYDNWFDEISFWPGALVKDGPTAAALVKNDLGDIDPLIMNIDIGGIGSSAYDSLRPMYKNLYAVNAASSSEYRDKSGKLKMRNLRAEYYWRMRDALDPNGGDNICLPPGNEIVADLCSAKYKLTTSGVLVEEKEEIKKRIGRSPDKGESILYANYYPNIISPNKLIGFAG